MSASSFSSLLWWVVIGVFFFWMMRRGGCGGMGHSHGGHGGHGAGDEGPHSHSTSGKPIDPVCRMEVDPASAVGTRVIGGKTFFLCSKTCLDAFDKDPAAYAVGAAAEHKHGQHSAC